MINTQLLYQLTGQISQKSDYPKLLEELKKKYNTSLRNQTPREIQEYANKLNQRYEELLQNTRKHKKSIKLQGWGFGELKIFEWACLFISQFKQRQSSDSMNQQQIKKHEIVDKIKNIFLRKSKEFIKYQYTSFLKSKSSNKKEWKQAQEQMLFNIIEQEAGLKATKFKSSQWKYYSFLLFTRSKGKFFKTQKQCREKWANYLNPIVKHQVWTIEEDIRLFECINQHGFKWSYISFLFGHERTEHMVKNRFHSVIKSWNYCDRKGVFNKSQVIRVLKELCKQLKKKQAADQVKSKMPDEKETEPKEKKSKQQGRVQQNEGIQWHKNQQIFDDYDNDYQEIQQKAQTIYRKQAIFLCEKHNCFEEKFDQSQKRTQDDDEEHQCVQEESKKQLKVQREEMYAQLRGFDAFVFGPWGSGGEFVNQDKYKNERNRTNLLKQVTDLLERDLPLKIISQDEFFDQIQEKSHLDWLK